jgi:DNA-binding CsgD family transcriptional regulator
MESKANTPRLSPREFDVFNLLIEGKRVKEVASKLFISENTGKTHLKNMLEKYDAKSMCELVYKVLKQNKDLLAFVFITIQAFSMATNTNIEQRRRKTGRRTARITVVLKTQSKAVA